MKMKRLHVAVALLAVASFVSLLGVSLVGGTDGVTVVKIKSTTPVEPSVWWNADASGWLGLWSPDYSSWGRTYLHLVMSASDLAAGETITVTVYAKLPDATKTSYQWVKAASYTLTDTNPSYNTVMYVPSKMFSFIAAGPGLISLSFYLTGS